MHGVADDDQAAGQSALFAKWRPGPTGAAWPGPLKLDRRVRIDSKANPTRKYETQNNRLATLSCPCSRLPGAANADFRYV